MGVLGEHKKRQKERQRRLNQHWMVQGAIIIAIVGVIVILFSSVLKKWLPVKYGEMAASMVIALGQAAVSISVTALLFERFGYVDYTVERVCEALADDGVLNVLNDDRKKELKDILFEDIYLGRQPAQDPKALVNQLSTDIGDLLNSYYYEEHHTSCDISMITAQDGQRYFRRHVHRAVTIRPIRQGRECRVSRLYFLRTNGIPAGTRDCFGNELLPVKFLRVSVNDRPLEQDKDYRLEISKESDAELYSARYELILNDENLLEREESLRVELVYVTHAHPTDPLYSVTVDRPCKFFSCHIINSIPDYNLLTKSYGFMALGNSGRRMRIEMESGEMVRFRSWILPGDGTVAVLTPKQSASVCSTQEAPWRAGDPDAGVAEEPEAAGVV